MLVHLERRAPLADAVALGHDRLVDFADEERPLPLDHRLRHRVGRALRHHRAQARVSDLVRHAGGERRRRAAGGAHAHRERHVLSGALDRHLPPLVLRRRHRQLGHRALDA